MSDEVAVLMPNDNVNKRDIVLHYRDGGLWHISELHIYIGAMISYSTHCFSHMVRQWVPCGKNGWHGM